LKTKIIEEVSEHFDDDTLSGRTVLVQFEDGTVKFVSVGGFSFSDEKELKKYHKMMHEAFDIIKAKRSQTTPSSRINPDGRGMDDDADKV